MRIQIMISIALLATFLQAPAAEAPAAAEACVACHGADGLSPQALWPSLAGQNTVYLANQIKAFRDGKRENIEMMPFVQSLSDEDVAALARYYAGLPGKAAASGNPALVATGRNLAGTCTACHGMNGQPVASEWPRLAGQQADYLEKQLNHYKKGERVHPFMQVAVAHLDAEDFTALAAYYSQLKP